MDIPFPSRMAIFGSFSVMAFFTLGAAMQADQIPWGFIAGGLVVGFLIMGPLSWAENTDFVSGRKQYMWITVGILLLAALMVLVTFLGTRVEFNGFIGGAHSGFILAVLAEQTVVPSEYHSVVEDS